jgi:hypothetical protein
MCPGTSQAAPATHPTSEKLSKTPEVLTTYDTCFRTMFPQHLDFSHRFGIRHCLIVAPDELPCTEVIHIKVRLSSS